MFQTHVDPAPVAEWKVRWQQGLPHPTQGFHNFDLCTGTRTPPLRTLREPGGGLRGIGICRECDRPISFNTKGLTRHRSMPQKYDESTVAWAAR